MATHTLNPVTASPLRRLWMGVERLSIYLPVLLMALLAAGSYWLLRATPTLQAAPEARVEKHEPDSIMRRFSVRTYGPGGQLKSEVFGQEARHFADDGSMEIGQARIRSFSPEGVLTTASAHSVWTDATESEYILRGNAVVVRDEATLPSGKKLARLTFQGEFLRVKVDERRVLSDQPVELTRGVDRITANQLDYADREGVAQFTGRVRAQFAGPLTPHPGTKARP
jgi:lipopolysaccharide export system protein LptC